MALPKELVEKLACPRCHRALDYAEEEDKLKCHECRLVYRVIDNIPVLLIDKAEKLA